ERGVQVDAGGALAWAERPAPAPLVQEIERLRQEAGVEWPEGFVSELCTRAGPWIGEVTRTLQQGVALCIDYGLSRREYYDPRRSTGTLRCHYRQMAHEDPFAHPGLEDLTAWVDFARVAEAADAADL